MNTTVSTHLIPIHGYFVLTFIYPSFCLNKSICTDLKLCLGPAYFASKSEVNLFSIHLKFTFEQSITEPKELLPNSEEKAIELEVNVVFSTAYICFGESYNVTTQPGSWVQ